MSHIRATNLAWRILNFSILISRFSFLIVMAALAFSGCARKADIKAQTSELEKAFPGAVATASATQTQDSTPAQTAPTDANGYVRAALSAVQNNDYAASVITLQKAQTIPGVTYDQFLALDRARHAINTDLINRADRGDAKAKADLKKIEATLSQ
jgi:hypothetical protein